MRKPKWMRIRDFELENMRLKRQVEDLDASIEQYKKMACQYNELEQCMSNYCYDCKYAVVFEGMRGRWLAGCAKNMICEDYRELNNDER